MEHQHHGHHQHVALAVFATAAVTAIIVGALVYNFQQKKFDEKQVQITKQLELAGNVVKDLQKEKEEAEKQTEVVSDALKGLSQKKSTQLDFDLPLVRYERAGLLTEAEKKSLENRLVGPYATYYNLKESTDPVITINIEVPEKKGDDYIVTAIHKMASVYFLHGIRGQEIPFWKPECMGPCTDYPKQFREKYPELVEKQ